MSDGRVERRLAAILVADIAGYSRLIGQDEAGTLARLRALRGELIEPKIAEHKGRIVKTTGDGLLVEFPSVVEAVSCAVALQKAMPERNEGMAADQKIEFRVGVHQGDIVVEDGDIFGDGVNVAARLEGMAEPGGICVSARVQEDVTGRLDVGFRDLGDQQLKNIARSVRVYALEVAAVTPHVHRATSTPRLSIVVLPFANFSNDPEQKYFADAITEDLTTDLSRIAGMFVIARNTAFTYQGRSVDVRQVGSELGVRYVLEGSVRRSGGRIRINAQLVDAESSGHLWAERFDGDLSDLFALQDEVTSRIAVALNVALNDAEAARQTENPDALEYIFRGRAAKAKPHSRETDAEAIGLFERALELDPRSIEALGELANALAGRAMDGLSDEVRADIARAEAFAEQALRAAPRSSLAHFAKGQVLRAQAQVLGMESGYDEAIPEYETALALDRNLVLAIAYIGRCKLMNGSIEEVIPLVERAIRLSPRDPVICNWYEWVGHVHLLQSRTDEAILWLEKARRANPAIPNIHARLAAAYGLKGDTERAAIELAEARRLSSDSLHLARLSRNYLGAPKCAPFGKPLILWASARLAHRRNERNRP